VPCLPRAMRALWHAPQPLWPACPSVRPSIRPSVHSSVRPSVCLPVCLPALPASGARARAATFVACLSAASRASMLASSAGGAPSQTTPSLPVPASWHPLTSTPRGVHDCSRQTDKLRG
jgi:hypothetical protein